MRTNMRSIVIAFLFWHCCSHPMVACTQTESTTSTAGTTHSPGVKSTIAHVNRKESAFVTDERNTVAKTSCSDIDVGQRPAVDTSVVITAKQPVAVNEAKTSIADQNYPDSTATDNVDIRGRSIDSPSPRSCIASRDCASSLHETCAASDAGLVCGCGQGYIRNKQTKTCELAGDVPRRDVEDDADEIDRQSREGTPQEAVSGNTAHADEELSSDDQDPLPASEKILVEAELPIAVATTGESTDRVPELDDKPVNSISLEARALAVEPPKNLISADSTISMVECPAPWPEQKPKDPPVHSPEKAPLPEEMAARPQDSVEASSSDGTLNPRQESSETITPVAPTDNAQESREPGTLENSQTDSMQELPIASAEVSSSSMSDAPESSVKGSPRPSVSLESDAFAEADFSEQPSESTSESPQDLGPEGLPSSVNEVPEAADPQEPTDTEDESPEAVFYEKPVTPAIASVGVVIPEMPAVTSAASSTVSIQEEPAIATKGSSEDLDSNNPADFAEETSEPHVSAEETELEDESPCASLPAETEGTSGETSQTVSSEEPGSPLELQQQASDLFKSKAVARGAPRALTAASSKCDAVLDTPRSSDANTETESGSERAAEMETIGGNSSEEFKSRGDTPPPLLPATDNSKTRETVH